MKRVLFSRILLFVYSTNLLLAACTEISHFDPEKDLLDVLVSRLEKKDFISSEQFVDSNPFESTGKELERVYHNLFKYPMAERNGFIYGHSLVPDDEGRQIILKRITRIELEAEGMEYCEACIDEFTIKMSGYKLTSEDMVRFFQDAETAGALTSLEHAVIMLQLRAISSAKSNLRVQQILQTVEFEVLKSSIPSYSKSKILVMNAIARNLINDPRISLNTHFLNLSFNNFSQTTPAVIGTILVVWVVAALVTAWFDPGCDTSCQYTMYTNAFAFALSGWLVCEFLDQPGGEPCPDGCLAAGCYRHPYTFDCICP
jgi:hypothetical protein